VSKSLPHVAQRKQKRGGTPGGKSIPHARSLGGTRQDLRQCTQLKAIWESFPEALIAYDRHQKITRINAAACKLFEVGSQAQCQGRDYQQFLTSYIRSDEQPPLVSREQWLMNLVFAGQTGACSPALTLLHLPSGRKISVTVRSFPVGDQGRDTEGTVWSSIVGMASPISNGSTRPCRT